MPEGDTIYKVAAAIRPRLQGQVLTHVDARKPRMVRGLVGARVNAIETVGKHLLMHFDDATILRTHLGMKGDWHRYAPGERWRQPQSAFGLLLGTERDEVVCFYPMAVDRFRSRQRTLHPVLSKLGPDILADEWDVEVVIERARKSPVRTIAELLLDQSVTCGIGNVYKSEVLFLEGVDPFRIATQVDVDTLRRVYRRARRLMLDNLGPGERNTTGRRPALWIYGAVRRSCARCGGTVEHAHDNSELPRITWWCPTCQPALRIKV